MMPFSVLRPWLLGIFSWAVFGTGVYLLWEWADGIDPPVEARRVVDPDTGETVAARPEVPADERDTQGGTKYLAWGLGLLLFSFAGCVPVMLFLGKPRMDEPQEQRSGEQRVVPGSDGSHLHVEIYGAAGRPTLLCTHGWSLDSTEWYYVKKALSDRFRIVVWDLPGLGRSQRAKSQDYTVDRMARDLEAVLMATCEGPAILVGHSIGGMICQSFCRQFPQHLGTRVSGIALVHTTYTNPLTTALGAPLWTAIQKPIIEPLNHLTIWLSPLVWISNWMSYLNGSLQVSSRVSSFAGTQTWGQVNYSSRLFAKANPAVTSRGNLGMLRFDAQDALPSINVPVLVVSGRNDRLTKPEASEYIDRVLPHGITTELKPAGHLGHWEQNSPFVDVLAQFAEKHSCNSADPAIRATSKTV